MIELAYIQTCIGDFIFPYTFRIDHDSPATITDFPVHTGSPVTDHMFINPNTITIEIGASDVMDEDGSSISVYEKLKEIQAERKPLSLTTRLYTYNSVVIESINTSDDFNTQFGLRATVTFKEIIIANVSTVEVSGGNSNKPKKSSAPSKSKSTNRGETQTKSTNNSNDSGGTKPPTPSTAWSLANGK